MRFFRKQSNKRKDNYKKLFDGSIKAWDAKIEDVENRNVGTFLYLMISELRLKNEIETHISPSHVVGDIIGSIKDYDKYVEKIGSKENISLYHEGINENVCVYEFGLLELKDVIVSLPDNDAILIRLVWER